MTASTENCPSPALALATAADVSESTASAASKPCPESEPASAPTMPESEPVPVQAATTPSASRPESTASSTPKRPWYEKMDTTKDRDAARKFHLKSLEEVANYVEKVQDRDVMIEKLKNKLQRHRELNQQLAEERLLLNSQLVDKYLDMARTNNNSIDSQPEKKRKRGGKRDEKDIEFLECTDCGAEVSTKAASYQKHFGNGSKCDPRKFFDKLPHGCDGCDLRFGSAQGLQMHKNKVHAANGSDSDSDHTSKRPKLA